MTWRDGLQAILVSISGVLLVLFLWFYVISPESRKPDPEQTHIEAVHEFHQAMHKGGLPHRWFHSFPTPTKERRSMLMR